MLGGRREGVLGKAIGLAREDYGRVGRLGKGEGEDLTGRFVRASPHGDGLFRCRACCSLYVSIIDARFIVSRK